MLALICIDITQYPNSHYCSFFPKAQLDNMKDTMYYYVLVKVKEDQQFFPLFETSISSEWMKTGTENVRVVCTKIICVRAQDSGYTNSGCKVSQRQRFNCSLLRPLIFQLLSCVTAGFFSKPVMCFLG